MASPIITTFMKEENKPIVPDEIVMAKIHLLRGQKVMLDRDLAKLYDVKGFRLREQVKRNIERFPKNFMFQLTEKEVNLMVSQNAIPSKQVLGGSLPYAFTEYGVLMLANVLRNGRAIQMSIEIIEVFVRMKEILSNNEELLTRVEELEQNQETQQEDITLIFDYMNKLIEGEEETNEQESRKRIGFNRDEE